MYTVIESSKLHIHFQGTMNNEAVQIYTSLDNNKQSNAVNFLLSKKEKNENVFKQNE